MRANEALALMPLAKRWVMIGDLKQLPPVMEEAAFDLQDRAAARRGRTRRQLLRLDLGQGAGRLADHAAAPVPHARADRPRRLGPLLRRQADPRGAAPADAAAVAVRPRAGVGRHRRPGRVPRRPALGRQRVRGGAVQGHHLDHPPAGAQGEAGRDRDVQLAGQPAVSPRSRASCRPTTSSRSTRSRAASRTP